MHYSLLLVEGKTSATESPFQYLHDNGHSISVTHTLQATVNKMQTEWPDLVILNLQSEGLDALQLTQALNKTHLNIPQLVVASGNISPELKVEAWVHAPYSGEELVAEIERTVDPGRFLRWPELTLDTHNRALLRSGVAHHLTPKLFELFMLLVNNQGKIVYRKTIMQEVWETDYMGDTRTLDVHMRWLREKTEDDPSHPKHILTVRGAGYRFMAKTTS